MKINFNFLLILSIFFAFSLNGFSQKIDGKIIDSETKENLSYVNIGVLNSTIGTITNESGRFILDCDGISSNSEVRITMIGYKSKSISVKELSKGFNLIKLEKDLIELEEIVVAYHGFNKKIGTSKPSKIAGVCGWGGTDFGKGHELGLIIDLGEKPLRIDDLNLKVHKQSFDTIMFRLHIRKLENGLPTQELLTQNIYFEITNWKGWQKIDLSKYNIVSFGKVALTIEWIKISNVIEKRLVKMNGSKQGMAVVLFDTNNKTGTFLIRKGSEAPWKIEEGSSPAYYLNVSN